MTSRARLTRALLAAAMFGIAACAFNDILGVHVPGRVQEGALDDPSLANTLAASAVSDLECAWNNYVAAAALIGDEFIQASGNLNQRNWASRRITADEPTMAQGSCRTAYGIYTPLQTARFQAEDLFKRIDAFPDAKVPNKTLLKAQVRAYGAFALVALGEGFCQMALDGGPLMAPKDVLAVAETRFTDAITLATTANSSDILNMALVGRARVRLDLQNFAYAAAERYSGYWIPPSWQQNASLGIGNAPLPKVCGRRPGRANCESKRGRRGHALCGRTWICGPLWNSVSSFPTEPQLLRQMHTRNH